MAGLYLVGAPPADADDVMNRLAVNTQIDTAPPTAATVADQLNVLTTGPGLTYPSKSYVDGQDATYQLPTYYQSQDALNVPVASIGQPNGVAPLDPVGDVPLANMPVLGTGYILGPWGPTAVYSGTTAATPFKIADWNIGNQALQFRPLVFMSVFATGLMAHPIIEVRIADSTVAVPYASGTLVAAGQGRALYNDYHAISVTPVPNAAGVTPGLYPTGMNIWLSAWIFDLNGSSVTTTGGNVASASAFLLRGAL